MIKVLYLMFICYFIVKVDNKYWVQKVWSLHYTYIIKGSRLREIQAKKSPCEGWLCFLVGQKRKFRLPCNFHMYLWTGYMGYPYGAPMEGVLHWIKLDIFLLFMFSLIVFAWNTYRIYWQTKSRIFTGQLKIFLLQ